MGTGEQTAGTTALAFPGQGGDWRAAVAVLHEHAGHPLVRALAERLGTARWDELDGLDTRNAQPAIYVSGLVGTPASSGPDRHGVAIGHSLGEITAAAWAGALDPEAGLDLVVARAAAGHASHVARPGAMAAVMRWDRSQVEWLRRRVLAEAPGTLDVAVTNSATQLVLSGDVALVERAVAVANEEGGVARLLPIGGGYHSPLMVPVLDGFRNQVARVLTRDPAVPVVSSTSGSACTTAGPLAEAIARSLVLPVDWPGAVEAAQRLGATAAVDAGPGDTLTRLARFLPQLPFETR